MDKFVREKRGKEQFQSQHSTKSAHRLEKEKREKADRPSAQHGHKTLRMYFVNSSGT